MYEKRLKEVLERRLKGESLTEIAKAMGVHRRTVCNYWRHIRGHPERFTIQNFDLVRTQIWERLFKLLDDPHVKEHQSLRALVDVLRSIEPIHQKLEVEQKPSKIEVSWKKDE